MLALSVFAYTARRMDQFDIDAGDVLRIVDKSGTNWLLERLHRGLEGTISVRLGYVPSGCFLLAECKWLSHIQ